MKILSGITLFAALSFAQPNPEDGSMLSIDCTDVSGAGTVAKGRWDLCGVVNGEPTYCKTDANGVDQSFVWWEQFYHLTEGGNTNSILGYCTRDNADSIFECTGAYHNLKREKPTARFAQCFAVSRRRLRISGGGGGTTPGSCWPANEPRIVSVVNSAAFRLIFGITQMFIQLMADPDAGCSLFKPIYRSAPDEFPHQFELRYEATGRTSREWRIRYPAYPNTYLKCTSTLLRDCFSWDEVSPSSAWTVFSDEIVYNEYRACQYMESTRDISTRPNGASAVAMSIDDEERCFFGRPAWFGIKNNVNYYVSFEWQYYPLPTGEVSRWIVTTDYISYDTVIDSCRGVGDLNECLDSSNWDGSTSVQVVTTGPYIEPKAPRMRTFDDLPSSNINTLAACAALNFALVIAQCAYKKRQAGTMKDLSSSEL